MHRHWIVLSLLAASWLGSAPSAVLAKEEAEKARPNVVFIISDDHDNEHLGFMGNTFTHTPTLDSLARGGAVFTTAHLPMSRCHPTLASFLSGQWPHQSGVYYNYGPEPLPPQNSLANLLKHAGYATYADGKYWEGSPREMGFTHGPGKASQTFVRKGQDELFSFIDEVGGKQPFFVWWAPMIPHTPHNPPQKYSDLYDFSQMPVPEFVKAQGINTAGAGGKKNQKGWRKNEQLSYAMEAWLDDGVTQLVDKLKAIDQYENTLFVFVIDNGWCNGLVSKGSPFEKGVRTPIFFSWPGKIKPAQRFDGLVSTHELYPTILDYAGVEVPKTAAGHSLRNVIEGRSQDGFREALFGAIYPAFVTKGQATPQHDIYALYIRTPKWKYIYYLQDVVSQRNGDYFRIQSINTDFPTRKAGDEDLYAIDGDPYELTNLSGQAEQRALMDDLKAQCLKWWAATGGKPLATP